MTTPVFQLTDEERLGLAEMVQSKAWETTCQKLFDPQRTALREACCTQTTDIRYWQGFYAGFAFAERVVVEKSKPEEEIYQVKPPSEMDLMSRKR